MDNWAEDEKMTHDVVTIGLYNIPEPGTMTVENEDSGVVYGNHVVTNVQFSDPSTFKLSPGDNSINAILMKNNEKPIPEPPIMCFLRTEKGFINACIYQSVEVFVNEGNRIVKYYDFNNFHSTFTVAPASIKKHPTDPECDQYLHDMVRFIPGCRRSIVYGVPYDSRSTIPQISDLMPFEDLSPDRSKIVFHNDQDVDDAADVENDLFDEPEEQVIDQVSTDITMDDDSPNNLSLAFPVRESARRSKDVGQIILEKKYTEKMRQRGTTIHFDEHSGMLVMATSKGRTMHFISFADIRRPGEFCDWYKSSQLV